MMECGVRLTMRTVRVSDGDSRGATRGVAARRKISRAPYFFKNRYGIVPIAV